MNSNDLGKKLADVLRKWGLIPPAAAPCPIPVRPRPHTPPRRP